MPREPRALRQRPGRARAGLAHTLSARIPAPEKTLASAATKGRCCGEEEVVAGGAVVGKSCLKRLGGVSGGGGSGAAKRVSFASEPQVRVMSPPAVPRAVGGGETRRPGSVRFGGGGSSVLAAAASPVRRSMRNALNLGVGAEHVTVAACNSARVEEEGDVGETVGRKRKSRENSEHMVASAQTGISRRSTRSGGLLSEALFVPSPAVEKKRARSKGPDVKEQTLEEQPAKLENKMQPTKPATCSNSYQELASFVEEEYQEQVIALCKAPPLRRSSRNHSKSSGLLLNNNTSSESNNCARVPEEGNEVKIACLSTPNTSKDGTREGMAKEDERFKLSSNHGAKNCAGKEEQTVQAVVRKGCLKRSETDMSSGSSGVAKKVSFNLLEQAAAEVPGFRRRPCVAADEEAGSTAPLRWPSRNAVNSGAGNRVEKIVGAVSRNISAKADEEEQDAGEALDRKPKASENVEDIGYVWLLPNIATTNISQIVAATKSVANKMATKVVANFGKKLSLYHVDHGANKVGQATVVAMDQIDA